MRHLVAALALAGCASEVCVPDDEIDRIVERAQRRPDAVDVEGMCIHRVRVEVRFRDVPVQCSAWCAGRYRFTDPRLEVYVRACTPRAPFVIPEVIECDLSSNDRFAP